MKAAYYILARGQEAGETVALIDSHGGDLNDNVHRAAFSRELLADVPPSRMHASKKLNTIDRKSDGTVVMRFTDNTTHESDILIGADGIHSRVRQLILGEDNPTASPVTAGWWFLQLLKPYKEVQVLLGEELVNIDKHVEYCYPSDGVFLLHNILSEGELCQVAAVVKCDEDEAVGHWKKEAAAKELHFQSSND
jgi:salicylate hydroxylase